MFAVISFGLTGHIDHPALPAVLKTWVKLFPSTSPPPFSPSQGFLKAKAHSSLLAGLQVFHSTSSSFVLKAKCNFLRVFTLLCTHTHTHAHTASVLNNELFSLEKEQRQQVHYSPAISQGRGTIPSPVRDIVPIEAPLQLWAAHNPNLCDHQRIVACAHPLGLRPAGLQRSLTVMSRKSMWPRESVFRRSAGNCWAIPICPTPSLGPWRTSAAWRQCGDTLPE